MDLSVIVTTYNRADQLREALSSLIRQETAGKFQFEIVVVDNASTDGTALLLAEMAQGCSIPLRYVLEVTKGVTHARNRGIGEASRRWLAFFDDDQLAEPCWLQELVAVAKEKDASCVGGCMRLLFPVHEEPVTLSPVCRAILGETPAEEKPRKYYRKELPGTGNVLLKREVFDEVGQFDTTFSSGCEDADLFRRIKRKGIDIWYTPKALAFHVIPAYRLKEDYLIWCSLRDGVNYARLDRKERGAVILVFACIARLAKALLFNVPCLLLAMARKDNTEAVGCQCLLARTYGYMRQTLSILAPGIMAQESFFSRLDFRGERNNFSG